jgi:deoxyribodipyrimidine photolyase
MVESAPSNHHAHFILSTECRAQAVGVDSSTKLSPFCALGCITPRRIYQEVRSWPSCDMRRGQRVRAARECKLWFLTRWSSGCFWCCCW